MASSGRKSPEKEKPDASVKKYEKKLHEWMKKKTLEEIDKLKTVVNKDDGALAILTEATNVRVTKDERDKINSDPTEWIKCIQDSYNDSCFFYEKSDRDNVIERLAPITASLGLEPAGNAMKPTPFAAIRQNVEFYLDHLTKGKGSEEYKTDELTQAKCLILANMVYTLSSSSKSQTPDDKITAIQKLLGEKRKVKIHGQEKEMTNSAILAEHRKTIGKNLFSMPSEGAVFVKIMSTHLEQYNNKKTNNLARKRSSSS